MMRPALLATLTLLVWVPRQAPDPGVPSRDGLVVCVSGPACDAGAAVLAGGGNAVDAAVATAFALAVTYPSAGNIGGGGFMIVRQANGRATAFDFREKAPLRATPTMFLGADGEIDRGLTASGYLAPGVPGTVRGLELAHRKLGRRPWKDVVMPAVGLAGGFTLSKALADDLNEQLQGPMARFPASVAAYGKPGGGAWSAGDRMVLADLARTLQAIADGGADAFYRGPLADLIAADMAANGGLISKADLAAYRAKERRPVRGTYRGHDIITMPPPSGGGVALVEMLNILEQFDLPSRGFLTAPGLHLQIEAMRRAFLDRARHLGDPDFTAVPVSRLTSKAHARRLAASIDPERASSSVELGRDIVSMPMSQEAAETTHVSVVDRTGMAVALTYTLEGGYGSKVVVKGAGFLLNNEMGDFNRRPGDTNERGDIGTRPNLIAPGKRMLSSMTPTIVSSNGKLVLVTGSPGDRTIPNTVLRIILGVTTFGMTAREAVDAPRLHHQWLPDRVTVEAGRFGEDALAALRAMGHELADRHRQGAAHTIWVGPDGTAYGVPDWRSDDAKASTPVSDLTSASGGR
ncbi:MAG TPA: gamma-glutamyltransferase [Vicinamibacterales bacterium]|nr:gamma-glutamyltransferase [Vicinamibacterales bacterium]